MMTIDRNKFYSINTASTKKMLKNSEIIFQRSLSLSKDLIKLGLVQEALMTMKKLISSHKPKKITKAKVTTIWKSLIYLAFHSQQKNRRKWNKRKRLAMRNRRGERL